MLFNMFSMVCSSSFAFVLYKRVVASRAQYTAHLGTFVFLNNKPAFLAL